MIINQYLPSPKRLRNKRFANNLKTPVLRRKNCLKKSYNNAKMSLQNAKMNLNKPNKLSILSSRNKELRQLSLIHI